VLTDLVNGCTESEQVIPLSGNSMMRIQADTEENYIMPSGQEFDASWALVDFLRSQQD
jgi:hypothetical protein